ncbi:acetolactate synthase small subunit [Serratia inhibens]|uniref:acetolactate synthase small subunit n=1 Tax=Serratia inhibens TaxID=2338073 RepID=UPI00321730D9
MSEQHSNPQVILELAVRNHPGVMSHVCGLFARRAFNVEGILCMPLKDGKQSRIWLLVADDQRLVQMISQVEKLEDVLQVKRHNEDMRVFEQLETFFQ